VSGKSRTARLVARGLIVVSMTGWLTGAGSASAAEVRLVTTDAEPQSLAIAAHASTAALVWQAGGEGGGVWTSVSLNGGRAFSRPTSLARSAPRDPVARPAVAVLAGKGHRAGAVVAGWVTMTGDGGQGLTLARSTDLGATFQVAPAPWPAGLPRDARASTLTIAPDGRWHSLWLTPQNHVYYAQGDGTLAAPARRLDHSVSRCGITALATRGETVHAIWYRRFGPEDEEFTHVRSTDGGRTFAAMTRVSQDHWRFPSCPGRSPSLSVDASGALRFAFQAVAPGAGAAPSFFSDTSSDGRAFRPRTFLGAASGFSDLRSPHVASDGQGGLSLAWDGVRNNRRYVMIRHSLGAPGGGGGLDADWLRLAPPIVLDQTGAGSTPVVTPTEQAMLVAWVTGGPRGSTVVARRMSIEELCGLSGQNAAR
jgi:hypothetical protein